MVRYSNLVSWCRGGD